MMIQRYSSAVTVVTRVIKSINVNKKIASRGHFIDQSIIVSKPVPEGDLVLIHRLKDIHNQGRVHVDLNGRGMQVRQSEAIPVDAANVGSWLQRMCAWKLCLVYADDLYVIFYPSFTIYNFLIHLFIYSSIHLFIHSH